MRCEQLYQLLVRLEYDRVIAEVNKGEGSASCCEAAILAIAKFSSEPEKARNIFSELSINDCPDGYSKARFLEARIICDPELSLQENKNERFRIAEEAIGLDPNAFFARQEIGALYMLSNEIEKGLQSYQDLMDERSYLTWMFRHVTRVQMLANIDYRQMVFIPEIRRESVGMWMSYWLISRVVYEKKYMNAAIISFVIAVFAVLLPIPAISFLAFLLLLDLVWALFGSGRSDWFLRKVFLQISIWYIPFFIGLALISMSIR